MSDCWGCILYQVLKDSEFCSFDASHPDVPLQLVLLRKWCNLYPSQEFRCFVRDNTLIAISQRHHSQHWPYLQDLQYQLDLKDEFAEFHENVMKQSAFPLSDYVFDVYRDKKDRIWLIDMNARASQTDALVV